MKNTKIIGQLEIDHNRGVIYFHAADDKAAEIHGVTPLRICGVKGIPAPAAEGIGDNFSNEPG